MKFMPIFSGSLIAAICSYSWADVVVTSLPEPPPLSSYMAYRSPAPPIQERINNNFYYLEGWYITAQAGYSFLHIGSLSNDSSTGTFFRGANISKSSFSANKFSPGVAIGYQFRQSGIFSRVELNYLPRFNMNYDANPFLDPAPGGIASNINGSLNIHPLLLKVYDDFYFDSPIIPFIQAGVGASFNNTSSDSSVTLGIPPLGPFINFQGNSSDTTTSFAWDVGAGVRWQIAPPVFLSLGYEFDGLGKAEWNLRYHNNSVLLPNTIPLNIQSGQIYSNTIIAGLTWMPIPKIYI